MARLLVRDRTLREFEIDESALPFWESSVEVLDRIPDPGEDPAPDPANPAPDGPDAGRGQGPTGEAAAPANPEPAQPGKTTKAAARPAQDKEE